MSHTPTPWAYGSAGKSMEAYSQSHAIAQAGEPNLIAGLFYDVQGGRGVAEANAAFIVKAVNSHDKLVEALKAVRAECMGYVPRCADLIDAALEGL